MKKISKAEKMLIKALIALSKEKGTEPDARWIEIDVKDITGNSNNDHRQLIEDYAQSLIEEGNK